MSETRNQNYLHGAAILAFSVVIVKILGAIYKIPIANILGDEGYAHFTVAYNLYALLLTISTAGLPVAVSKLISEANTLGRPLQAKKIFVVAIWAFAILGAIGSLAMYLFPTELAILSGDVEASHSIKVIAPSVFIVCIMSAFRGFFQGHSDMRPTSISQVIEVAGKVFFGLALTWFMAKTAKSDSFLAACANSGVTFGSLAACLFIIAYTFKDYKKYSRPLANPDVTDKTSVIAKRLLKVGVPIALGSSVSSIITLLNTKLILERLQMSASLSASEAGALFGVYSKILPLYNLPYAFITPLTISIIPAIASHVTQRQHHEAKKVTESSLRISCLIAMPMAVGMSVLSSAIMIGLFEDRSGEAQMILSVLGLASFFLCLALMTTSILQASGYERLSMITNILGGVLNLVISWILVGNPSINIMGATIGLLGCYVFMSALNLLFIKTKMKDKPKILKPFLMPLISSIAMGFVAWLVYPACLGLLNAGPEPSRFIVIVAMAATICLAVIVYAFLAIFTRAITLEDMKLIPKGEKLAKLLRIH